MKLTRIIPEREIEIQIETIAYHTTGEFVVRYISDGVSGSARVGIKEVYDEKQMQVMTDLFAKVIEKALNLKIQTEDETVLTKVEPKLTENETKGD